MTALMRNNILFGFLFTSFSTPMIFFMMGLPMILQLEGFDASFIGLFQMIALPMVIKFLISMPIDKIVFRKNHYKKWIYFIAIGYIMLLLGISFLSLHGNIYVLFFAILITTLIATFIDIPLNALAIKVFSHDEYISAGSYKISAFFLSGLLGGGILLLFYNHLGWQVTFFIMIAMILLSLLASILIEEKDEKIESQQVSFSNILSFFKQKHMGIWMFILCFYFAFISAIWIFMKPYLISKGVNADDVAIYVGIYGSIIGFFAGIINSVMAKKISKRILLIAFMCLNILSGTVLVAVEYGIFPFEYFLLAICLTAIGISLSSAVVFSLIMDYSRTSSRAIDYSIQASLFSLTRIISAVFAGLLVSNMGFGGMFIVETTGMLIVLGVIYMFYKN